MHPAALAVTGFDGIGTGIMATGMIIVGVGAVWLSRLLTRLRR